MKANVKRSCGHVEAITLYGGRYDQQLTREREKLCRECYTTQRSTEAAVLYPDLPALSGTPKQVSWALTIRAQALSQVEAFMRTHPAPERSDSRDFAVYQMAQGAIETLRTMTVASWWIDHRHAAGAMDWLRAGMQQHSRSL